MNKLLRTRYKELNHTGLRFLFLFVGLLISEISIRSASRNCSKSCCVKFSSAWFIALLKRLIYLSNVSSLFGSFSRTAIPVLMPSS